MSIGALARATGIPVETLRTWEARYGYPAAQRKPSGHRLYPLDAIARLRRISDALAAGHRPGDVVGASEAVLGELMRASGAPRPAAVVAPGVAATALDPGLLFDAVRRFDAAALTGPLVSEWARIGPIAFLEQRIAPLLVAVGDAWQAHELSVRHEHFVSQVVEDLLRTLRQPLAERARGARVVCATLAGELHGLGVQLAAVAIAYGGARPVIVGTDMPEAELLELVAELRSSALALSVTAASAGARSKAQLTRLRAALPRRVAIIVGGAGASAPVPGIRVVPSLGELADWARGLR